MGGGLQFLFGVGFCVVRMTRYFKNFDWLLLLLLFTVTCEALPTGSSLLWFMVSLEINGFLSQLAPIPQLGKNFPLLKKNHSQDLTSMRRIRTMFL